jgi:hypothetical protein
VFNGDYHWFDAEPAWLLAVEARVHSGPLSITLRGNVETEIAADDDLNGCGCAYPDSVPDADVARSNAILSALRAAACAAERSSPGLRGRLARLPMHAVAAVGSARIGIVHGDACALAGWSFAHDRLHDEAQAAQLATQLEQGAVDIFACSHTCLPALKLWTTGAGDRVVVNNGAAGMPNFAATRYGLITRIAVAPLPAALEPHRRYGTWAAGVYVDALAVPFATAAWERRFLQRWPQGSPACESYWSRIRNGPDFSIDEALGRAPLRACLAAIA